MTLSGSASMRCGPPNWRMTPTGRAGDRFAWKGVTRRVPVAGSELPSAAYAQIRQAAPCHSALALLEVRLVNIATPLLAELEQEAQPTRQLLERVPSDRLDWRPHPKSMTLGQLALHVAQVPGAFAAILTADEVDFATVDFETSNQADAGELLVALDRSLAEARQWLAQLDEEQATALYHARLAEQELFALPRLALVRSLMFNHWYHHRGQLCVYLRLLDVPLPPIYGPTADENPFGAAA
jgi:uncharacterized damage-inducible protein DinB